MVDIGNFEIEKKTDILTKAIVERVASTTDVEFIFSTNDGTQHVISEDTPVALNEFLDGRGDIPWSTDGYGKNPREW